MAAKLVILKVSYKLFSFCRGNAKNEQKIQKTVFSSEWNYTKNKYFHSILFKYQWTALWCLFDFFFLDRPVIVWMGRPCLLFADFLKTKNKNKKIGCILCKKNNWRENLKKKSYQVSPVRKQWQFQCSHWEHKICLQ